MDAVVVCAAIRRGVPQDEATIAAARAAAGDQLVIAANGYTTPLLGAGDDAEIGELLHAVGEAAEAAGAVPVVLHCPAGDPLLRVLPRLGYVVGITDLYASIALPGADLADLLATLPAKRRTTIRRELRALSPGAGRIVAGAAAEPFIEPAAELVAAAYRARGQSIEPAVVAGIYRRLLAAFGADFLLSMVFADGRPLASTCVLTARDTAMSYSAGFRLPEAKTVAGYFNAAYYLPIKHCYGTGRTTLLLGPGTLEAKRLRGARFSPLYSAVPRSCAPLAALLTRTDAWHRRRLAELPIATAQHPNPVINR
jgi:predicted N-acyltransferase